MKIIIDIIERKTNKNVKRFIFSNEKEEDGFWFYWLSNGNPYGFYIRRRVLE